MDHKLLGLLYCPVSQSKLEYDREHQVLISKVAGLVFPIRDGIPIMLESEAIKLKTWEENLPNEVAEHFANVAQTGSKDEASTDKAPVAKTTRVKTSAKTSAKKSTAKKTVVKKTAAKKPTAKKTAKKTASKSSAAKKVTAKKTAAKKTTQAKA